MPIQQISERKQAPVIGKIRLGTRKEGGGYPVNEDHFVLHDAPQVAAVYGSTPKELDIVFPSDDIEAVMPTWLKLYGRGVKGQNGEVIGGKLKCMGNGPDSAGNPGEARHIEKTDPRTRVAPTRPCLGERCPDAFDNQGNRVCKPAMNLYVWLPLVSPYGVFQIDTTSWRSIKSFHDQINWIRTLNNGRIARLPFKLIKEQQKVTYTDKNGKLQEKANWIMVLKPNEDKAQLEGMKQSLSLLERADIAWQPDEQRLLGASMEDNYEAVDAETSTKAEVSAQNVSVAEQVAADPEVAAAFDKLGAVRGNPLSPKDRVIMVRKKEKEPNVKEAVLAAIGNAIVEIEKKKGKPQEATPQQAAAPNPDAQGLI